MNIGFSTFVLQGGKSGVATYIRELLHALQEEDSENTYDLLMARDEEKLIQLTHSNFNKSLFPSILKQPLINLAWHNLGLAQKKYDVLHIPSYRRIPLLKRTKLVATVHDLAAFSVEAKYGRSRMIFNQKVAPSMIRRADRVITVSQHTKNDLVRWVGYPEDKISVISSGIDHRRFHPLPKAEAQEQVARRHGLRNPFFIYVSRLEHPAKNHIRLIEAFEQFKRNNDNNYQLIFVGADWSGSAQIHARAKDSPVSDAILFLGFVPIDSLPLLYSGCEMMIYPSLFEGFGFPIVEALACGAAVACSNTSSMKEIAGNRLPTFDPTRPDEICQGMESIISNGWGAKARQQGLDYSRTFDWNKTARRVTEVYQSVV